MGTDRRYDNRRRSAVENTGNCELQNKLRAIDFALVEVALYLDAYPDNCEALAYYHKLMKEREALAEEMSKTYGPLNHRDNRSQSSWQWVQTPWPWEHEAN